MSGRLLPDWLTAYLEYTKRTEPPLSYHTWVGISVLAAALQRRVWLHMGFEVIYPNMYIVLVGPSGKARKGAAIAIGKDILKSTNIALSSESNTREALILAMKRNVANFQVPKTGRILFHCSLTAVSEELSVFLGQSDIKYLANLTDWYDAKDDWTYETKGTGKDHLQGVCLNLLGATAPDWLQSMLPQEAVGGGFTSRVIFIVEDRKGKTVPIYKKGEAELKLENALQTDLDRIASLSGQFEMTEDGEKFYKEWYEGYDKELDAGKYPVDDPRFAGYCERRQTHLRKLAMVMSASRGDDLLITKRDLERSLSVMKGVELKMSKAFGGLGRAKYSEMTEKVMEYIRKLGKTTRSSVMRAFYRDVDSVTLKVIEEVMEHMKVVKITVSTESRETIYEWIGKK